MSVIAKGISKLFKPKRRRGPKSKAKSEEQIKVIGQERESKPVQKTPNRKREVEGARLDPDASDYTGGVGARTARDVGTRGEKVTVGGLTINNFVRDQASKGMKDRGKAKAKLAKLAREGETPEIRKEAQAAYNKMEKQDIKATNKARQTAKQTSEKPKVKERLKAAYKGTLVKKQDKRDPVQAFLNDGEIIGNFNPTVNQQKQAVSSLKARGKTKKAREIEAMLELGPKKAAKQKTKELRMSNRRKAGGKVINKRSGGSIKPKKKRYLMEAKEGGKIKNKKTVKPKLKSKSKVINVSPGKPYYSSKELGEGYEERLPSAVYSANLRKRSPFGKASPKAAGLDVVAEFQNLSRGKEGKTGSRLAKKTAKELVKKNAGGKVMGYKKGGKVIKTNMSGDDVVRGCYD